MAVMMRIIDCLADLLRFGLVNIVYLELVVLACIGRIDSKAEANVKTIKIGITFLKTLFIVCRLVDLWLFELIKIAIEHVLRLLPSSLLPFTFPLTLKGFCLFADFLAFFAVHLCKTGYLYMDSLSTVNQLLQSSTIFLFEQIRDFL